MYHHISVKNCHSGGIQSVEKPFVDGLRHALRRRSRELTASSSGSCRRWHGFGRSAGTSKREKQQMFSRQNWGFHHQPWLNILKNFTEVFILMEFVVGKIIELSILSSGFSSKAHLISRGYCQQWKINHWLTGSWGNRWDEPWKKNVFPAHDILICV